MEATLRNSAEGFHRRQSAFNGETETWEKGQFELPYFEGDFVLLTPKDLLTKDDTWINKTDLADEFASLPAAIPNQQLRDLINNYFRKVPPKKATRKQEPEAAISNYPTVPRADRLLPLS